MDLQSTSLCWTTLMDVCHIYSLVWVSLRALCIVLINPPTNAESTLVFLFAIRPRDRIAHSINFRFLFQNQWDRYLGSLILQAACPCSSQCTTS